MENKIEEKPVETAPALTLTEEDIDKYIADKIADGVTPDAGAKYRSHLQNLCKWLSNGEVLTKKLLLEWRAEIEKVGYSRITVEKYVTSVDLYTKYRGRPDLNIKKSNALDLLDKQYGYLTVIAATEKKLRTDNVWLCRCKCGKEIEVAAGLLARGNTTSCGCLNVDILRYHNRYEEGTELRQSMEERIFNPKSASGYVGVRPHKDKWSAHITYKGKNYYLGTFSNIDDAIKARARAKEGVIEDAVRIYAETEHLYGEAPHRPPRPIKEDKPFSNEAYHAKRNNNTSGCAGVKCEGKRWKAEFSSKGVRYHLGLYENFEQAADIRKTAEALALAGDIKGIEDMSISFTTYKTKRSAHTEKK